MTEPADTMKKSRQRRSGRAVTDVAVLTSFHPVRDSRIWMQEARSIARHVGSVTVIGPDGDVPEDPGITFLVFERPKSLLARMLTFLKLFRLAWATPARVYHCHELDATLAAVLVKMLRPCRVIFDSHELYREMISLRFPRPMRPFVKLMIFLFEIVLYSTCDAVITVTEGVAAELARATPREKITVIYNASGQGLLKRLPCAFPDNRCRILCLGHMTFRRGVREMCRAVEIVYRRHPEIVFYILGRMDEASTEWVARFRRRHDLAEVIQPLGYVPFNELGAYLPYVDIGIMGLQRNQNTMNALPVKLFDYMSFGIPAVASDLPEIRRLNGKYEVAVLVDTARPEAIAAGILRLLEDEALRRRLSQNALRAVQEEYSWAHMERRLMQLYAKLLKRPELLPATAQD